MYVNSMFDSFWEISKLDTLLYVLIPAYSPVVVILHSGMNYSMLNFFSYASNVQTSLLFSMLVSLLIAGICGWRIVV